MSSDIDNWHLMEFLCWIWYTSRHFQLLRFKTNNSVGVLCILMKSPIIITKTFEIVLPYFVWFVSDTGVVILVHIGVQCISGHPMVMLCNSKSRCIYCSCISPSVFYHWLGCMIAVQCQVSRRSLFACVIFCHNWHTSQQHISRVAVK